MVYQEVTRNKTLSPAAKGLYAYLSSFCGTSDECYPSVATIIAEMVMGNDTFYRQINALVAAGVVEKRQTKDNKGKFQKVVYRLTHEVGISEKPIPQNEYTGKRYTAHRATNNNNINSNNINNNNNKDVCVQPEVDTPSKAIQKKKTSRFVPPTVEEVRQYCLENSYTLDAHRFVDFYECKGWMVGKNKMKNWKAAVRTWVRKDQKGVARDEAEPTNSVRLW